MDEDHVLHTFAMCRVWQKESTGGRSDTQKCHWRQERSAARSAPLRHPTVRTATSRRTGPATLCHPGTDDNSESCRIELPTFGLPVARAQDKKNRRPRPRLEWSLVELTRLSCTCMRCGSLYDSRAVCKFNRRVFRLFDLSRKMFRDAGGLKIVTRGVGVAAASRRGRAGRKPFR